MAESPEQPHILRMPAAQPESWVADEVALYLIALVSSFVLAEDPLQGIAILRERLVHDAILFPTGPELEQLMVDFQSLCGLPCCGGALDGTFIPIKKPSDFSDTYYCYKHFTSIIVLGCVDARGIFTYVNASRPGSVGDSYTSPQFALPKDS